MDDITSFKIHLERGDPKVVVVGGGYVGLPLAVAFAQTGCRVTVLDTDQTKADAINAGRSYVGDVPSEKLAELVEHNMLRATTDPAAYEEAHAVLICVPTPLAVSREPDTSLVRAAIGTLCMQVYCTNPQLLVVLESTVYPGFTREELAERIIAHAQHVPEHEVYVAFSPERVDPANKRHGVENTPKVVGGIDKDSTDLAAALYRRIVPFVVPVSSADTAELVKLLENTYRAVNIALVNEFALAARELGINIWEVVEAAGTKPFGFQKFTPGPGVGGHCIGLDPPYLSWRMRGLGHEMRLLDTAILVNRAMPGYVVDRLAAVLNEDGQCLNGADVCVLGVAYKPDVPDTRESPALDIIRELGKRGAVVTYYDPFVPSLEHEGFALKSVEIDTTLSYVRMQDSAIIVTNHSPFDYAELLRPFSRVLDTRGATREAGYVPHEDLRVVLL
jgi:UDP-N-acetyl-D-glucosamine dehydrogenase